MHTAPHQRTLDEISPALGIELESFSVMTAIAGSIGNALERKMACEFCLSDIRAYLPSGAGLRTTLDRFHPDGARQNELVAALTALGARAGFTRDLALAVETSTGSGHADPALIADPARRLASMCFVVRNIFQRAFGSVGTINGSRQIDRMLRLVSGGGTPCLDGVGKLSVPGWIERRQVRRRAAMADVAIDTGTMRVAATIENASATGLGILAVEHLPTGAHVAVLFTDGSERRARVIWSDGLRAGLTVGEPLADRTLNALSANDAMVRS